MIHEEEEARVLAVPKTVGTAADTRARARVATSQTAAKVRSRPSFSSGHFGGQPRPPHSAAIPPAAQYAVPVPPAGPYGLMSQGHSRVGHYIQPPLKQQPLQVKFIYKFIYNSAMYTAGCR